MRRMGKGDERTTMPNGWGLGAGLSVGPAEEAESSISGRSNSQ